MADVDVADFNPAFGPKLAALRARLAQEGYGDANIISGYRSPEYQQQLRNQGVRPAARPWQSFHQYGLAADLNLSDAGLRRMWELAPQFGLHALGPYDKSHVQLGTDLGATLAQNNIPLGWRPASQPAPAQGAIAYSGPSYTGGGGSSGGAGASASYAPAGITLNRSNPFIYALGKAESDWRNIPSQVDKDYPGMPGSRSKGLLQIDDPTWKQFAPQAGVTAPNAMAASEADQIKVASLLPISRFGGRTLGMLTKQFGNLDRTQTVGQLAAQYAPAGSTINTTGGPSAGSQTASAAPQTGGGGYPNSGGTGQPQGSLLGYTPGSPAEKMALSAAKTLGIDTGKGGPGQDSSKDQQELRPSPMIGGAPQAAGGPMMAGAGYQNMLPRQLASQGAWQNPFAQQGGIQTQLADLAMQRASTPIRAPGVMPGQAGITGLPGTTLNSPSALQYALASGYINPYDLYGGGGTTPPLSMGA